jgi:hypothetical protein
MRMLFQTVAPALGKMIGSLLLGGVILTQVASRVGPHHGRATVHVMTAPVNVLIDDSAFRVDSVFEPAIACELRPGRHSLRMIQDGRVLFLEEFAIAADQDIILVCTDQSGDGRHPAPGGCSDRANRIRP